MEAEAQEVFTDEIRHEIFEWLGVADADATDLNGFENFVYGCNNRVIRITHDSHRTSGQLLGELEFVGYLAAEGAPVAGPVLLPDGSLLRSFGDFHLCQFRQVAGSSLRGRLPVHGQTISWGRAVGLFHRLTQDFRSEHGRQNWQQDENHDFAKRIPAEQGKVLAEAEKMMSRLALLPRDSSVYGLIHSDAHPGNFLARGNELTFFDFDDCLYAWFGYDVATILLGISRFLEDNGKQVEKGVADFLEVFLEGYEREMPRSSLMLEHMPLLLKLREFSLYAVILAHEVNQEGPNNFRKGRRERLENDVPYLDMDFTVFERV